MRADVYRAGDPDAFDGDDDSGRASSVACPRVDPAENTGVRMMAAGTYVVCLRVAYPRGRDARGLTLPRYSVHLSARP